VQLVPPEHKRREEPESPVDLRRLATALALLRREVERVIEETDRLAAIEGRRALTPDEASIARQLRWDGERLRLELAVLREEFDRVQAGQR
jgi:hypothetical protein